MQICLARGGVSLPGSVVRTESPEDGGGLVGALGRALGKTSLSVGRRGGVEEGERLDRLVRISDTCSCDSLAVAEVRNPHGVGDAVGDIDGRGEGVHRLAEVSGEVPRGAARGEEIGLAAQSSRGAS